MAKNPANKVEKLKRIRVIQEYLIIGKNPKDIVTQVSSTWNITPRMAQYYVRKAFEEFKLMNQKDIESLLGYHVQARLKLLDWSMESDKRKPFALDVLKDLAKLQGLYVNKVDLTSKGEAIQFGGIEIVAPNNDKKV